MFFLRLLHDRLAQIIHSDSQLIISSYLGIANPHAKRLYDDLLSNYNRLIRPVENNTEKLTVHLGLKLSQLIDVDLKNQVMTTNIWLEQVRY